MKQGALKTGLGQLQRALAVTAVASLGLVACGGSGGGSDAGDNPQPQPPVTPVATQLSGTAAIGAPVAGGKVQVRCADASAVLESVTNAAGVWQVNTTGQSLPCAVRVSGGNLGANQALHSAALDFGNLNITPLTDLMVANATGKQPAAWWGNNGPADFSALTDASVTKALQQVRSALGLPALQTLEPRTTAFNATPKDVMDDILEALQSALATSGIDYAALLNEASKSAFTLSQNFKLTLSNAYATITIGGAGAGTGTDVTPPIVIDPGTTPDGQPIPRGDYTLTINVTASGFAAPPVVLTKMPKPNTEGEFCDDIMGLNSDISLKQSIPAETGSLTINSCAFNGSVGRVSATLLMISPVSMTVPYSVVYTYK